MLSTSNPRKGGSGQGYYFQYYTRDAQERGFWFGRGADLFGLPAQVSKRHFNNLLQGFSADGTHALVQNAGDPDRRGFWDLTLSVPKPVSVLYAASPEMAGEIRSAAETAVRSTLMELEDSLGMSRKLKAGKLILPASLAFAVFGHDTSRSLDPQLHFHCALVNTAWRIDGTTGAVHTKPIYEEKLNIGQLFREKLAAELTQRFGLKVTMERNTFQIEGVSLEICEEFSKRSKEIRAYMKKHALRGGEEAGLAAIKTRGPKNSPDREVLVRKWLEIANQRGLSPKNVEIIWKRGQERLRARALEAPRNGRPFSTPEQPVSKIAQHSASTEVFRPTSERSSVPPGKNRGTKSKKEERERLLAFRKFERELRDTKDRIFAEKQTRPRLMRVGFALAYKHNVDRNLVAAAVDKLKLPTQRRFYRIEWAPLFPKAPRWSGLKRVRAPKIVLRNRARRWGRVTRRIKLPTLGSRTSSIAVQRRSLFPNSPAAVLRNFTLPAIRLRRDKLEPAQQVQDRKPKRSL